MGYRSEVLIAIQMDNTDEKSVKAWHVFITELKADSKCDSAMRELMNGKKHAGLGEDNGIDMINCSLYVDFRETKWYDGYDLVDSYNHIVGKARQYYEDLDVGMSVCFIRVGEETTDVVEDCYGDMGHQLAYLSRPTIEIEDITFDPDNKLIN
jgi:hypothetical protein|tara:strand:- start:3077 stop:3535 length:459 start_codon:yes stop_codon:yes gene_type:complete